MSTSEPTSAPPPPPTSTTRRPLSKRVSTAPAPPKAPTTLDPSAVLANHCVLTGTYPITIGAQAILHPHCKIISTAGPVHVGAGVIVWERAVVGISSSPQHEEEEEDGEEGDDGIGGGGSRFVMLERNCVVESGAVIAAKLVGEGTIIEAFAQVGEGCVVGKYCKIAPHTYIPANSVIEDYTIVYGQNQRRRDTTAMKNASVVEIRNATHQKQLKTLQQIIPSNMAKWLT